MFPSTITPGPRQDAFDFGANSADLSDAEFGQAMRDLIDPRDFVAACIGRRGAVEARA